MNTNTILTAVLEPDIAELTEALCEQSCYRFCDNVSEKMKAAGLSAAALGSRCLVSHTIVDKWRLGKAKPNGKERYKELGMALGMDASALSRFLYLNGYPRLHAKNPLDNAASFLLNGYAGREDIVSLYRELIQRLGLADCSPVAGKNSPATVVMSKEFKAAAAAGHLSTWFRNNRANFTDNAKTRLPGEQLCGLIELYLPDGNLNELGETGVLPVTLKNLLYPILAGRVVTVKNLREKLIALGILLNMTAEEIDTLLECEKLRALSDPASALDTVLFMSLERAHERYPLYEQENLTRIQKRLKNADPPYGHETVKLYESRSKTSAAMAAYYESHREKADLLFEEAYTSYADKGIADYIGDILTLLTENNTLDQKETEDFWNLITNHNEEE